MFLYQKSGRYFAQVADGLQDLATAELTKLGATEVAPAYRGLWFDAAPKDLYRIVYRTRLLTRVLAPLLVFDCHSTRYLYKTARQMDWSQLLQVDQTFAVHANVGNSKVRHGQYASRVLKDAVADWFMGRGGTRPSVDPREPDLWLYLSIHHDRATIYVDCAGGSLHRRGYRRESVAAPLMETLAAAIVELSGWEGGQPLADPMCGSGTLLCEALLKQAGIPAGYLRRRFGLEHLPDYDAALWKRVKDKADAGITLPAKGLLFGNEINGLNLEAARANAALLPGGDRITWRRGDFRELSGLEDRTILCNPPYGKRLETGGTAAALLTDLGDFLKQRCTGSRAFIYVGDRQLLKSVGLRPSWKKALRNGALDGRLACYEVYP